MRARSAYTFMPRIVESKTCPSDSHPRRLVSMTFRAAAYILLLKGDCISGMDGNSLRDDDRVHKLSE